MLEHITALPHRLREMNVKLEVVRWEPVARRVDCFDYRRGGLVDDRHAMQESGSCAPLRAQSCKIALARDETKTRR